MKSSSSNPFAAPKTEEAPTLPAVLEGLDAKGIKSLYKLSRNLRALLVIYILLGFTFLATAVFVARFSALHIVLALGFLLTGHGYYHRTNWGKMAGLVLAVLCLILFTINLATGNILIGALFIGVVGVHTYVKGKRLFGEDRITHQALKDIYLCNKD